MTVSSSDLKSRRFWILDVLRGLAILGVLSFHVLPLTVPINPIFSWVQYGGTVGVSIFFVLSGFSIHLSQLRKDVSQPFSWQKFLLKRVKRLYPPYLAAIGVAIAINLIWGAFKGAPFSLTPTPTDLLSHLLLVHSLHPQTFFGIIPALWFIGVLFHLYLLYPCFRWFIQRWGNTIALLIILAITLLARYLSHSIIASSDAEELTTILQNNAPQRWFEWCLGAWIAAQKMNKKSPPRGLFVLTPLLCIVWIILQPSLSWLSEPMLGFYLGSLLWYLVSWEPQGAPHSAWQPWLYLGKMSYSIYLLHQIFIPYLRSAIEPSPFEPLATFFLMLSGVLLLTLPSSIIIHRLLEQPALWRKRLFHE